MNFVNMKDLMTYLNEAVAGSIKKKIEFDIVISKSAHAEERQSRHGTDERNFISDEEIRETIYQATDRIIEDLVNNHLDVDDRFVVRDANTGVNIVCSIHAGSNGRHRLDVITVIRTTEFRNPHGTWVVMVR